MDPALDPALDLDAAARGFARDRRVHIPGILTADSAARVHRCLAQETDFALVCPAGTDQAQAWPVASLTQQKEAELMTAALGRAPPSELPASIRSARSRSKALSERRRSAARISRAMSISRGTA